MKVLIPYGYVCDVLTLCYPFQIRKNFKARFGVDPLENKHLSVRERYLKKVCRNLPPMGSAEREVLRGGGRSLASYLEQMQNPVDV